ncbi:hypothetical protein ACJX0J_006831 [Zea mays]
MFPRVLMSMYTRQHVPGVAISRDDFILIKVDMPFLKMVVAFYRWVGPSLAGIFHGFPFHFVLKLLPSLIFELQHQICLLGMPNGSDIAAIFGFIEIIQVLKHISFPHFQILLYICRTLEITNVGIPVAHHDGNLLMQLTCP